jgi:hypothetical protein
MARFVPTALVPPCIHCRTPTVPLDGEPVCPACNGVGVEYDRGGIRAVRRRFAARDRGRAVRAFYARALRAGKNPRYVRKGVVAPVVYLIRTVDENGAPYGPTKVGKANDMENRFGQLQSGNPRRLKVIYCVPGYTPLEEFLLEKYGRQPHLKRDGGGPLFGDWFNFGPDELNEVKAVMKSWAEKGWSFTGCPPGPLIPKRPGAVL